MSTATAGCDTAWLLISTALVMLMMPGLALFYGGLVRTKNVLSTFMHTFVALSVVSLLWVTIGYSLAFGEDHGGVIGGFNHVLLRGVGLDPRPGSTVPHLLFMAYQMMFAAITPALISGAFAERIRFSGFVLFTCIWSLVIYAPLAHWVWADGGWLGRAGALDFAGGIVVHASSGFSALVFALGLKARLGYPRERPAPHNLTMTLLGAGLLWFGWFGFNGGSALGANGIAALAVVNTQLAASAGAAVWLVIDLVRLRKGSSLGFASGFVAGLATVTPAAGYVAPMAAIGIGAAAGGICYGGVLLKDRFKYDDTLDAFGIHGVGGVVGTLLLGVLAQRVWNPAGADGLITGSGAFFLHQLLAVAVAVGWSVAGTALILKLVNALTGLRVPADVEREGLDINLHGEAGYAVGTSFQSQGWGAAEDASADERALVASVAK
jgi:ammonium transporter, Amt family